MENQQQNTDTEIVKKKRSPVRFIIIGIVAIAAIIFGYTKIHFMLTHETTDNAQIESNLIPVLTRVSGYIETIDVQDYAYVKAGDVIATLDDKELQLQLEQMLADSVSAMADLSNARASLKNAEAALGSMKGNVGLSKLKLDKSMSDLQRDKNLYSDSAATQKQIDDSQFSFASNQQQYANAKDDLVTGQSRLDILRASIDKAEAVVTTKSASINQQRLKLSYTKIYAPASGKIGRKNVSTGQYVQAGSPLFTIVGDGDFWIVANFKESQLKKLHEGMPVEISLDAYPKEDITGHIESLSDATGARFALLPPDNSSGNFVKVTQRLPVKITIDNASQYKDKLRTGLSAGITVATN